MSFLHNMFKRQNTTLKAIFEDIALKNMIPLCEIDLIYSMLPQQIQQAPIFENDKSKELVYEFGSLWDNVGPDKIWIIGSDLYRPVAWLLNGLIRFVRKCPEQVVREYCSSKLAIPDKHMDYLSELDPVTRPRANFSLQYEPYDKKLDWQIDFEHFSCLLEVKHRINVMMVLLHENWKGDGNEKAPTPVDFFKDTEKKFPKIIAGRHQGVWILCEHYCDPKELETSFLTLPKDKIEFVVVAAPGNNLAHIIARDQTITNWVKTTFDLVDRPEPLPLPA